MNQGKFVIIAMVAIGAAMAGFGWWVRYTRSQKVLQVWGPQAVIAIRTGDLAELLPVSPVGDVPPGRSVGRLDIEPNGYPHQSIALQTARDITDAPGLIHARHHLVHEKGFDWDTPRADNCTPVWEVAFRFSDEANVATVVLDFACNRAYLVERKTEVGMKPIIADALKKFLHDFDVKQEGSSPTNANPEDLIPSESPAGTP